VRRQAACPGWRTEGRGCQIPRRTGGLGSSGPAPLNRRPIGPRRGAHLRWHVALAGIAPCLLCACDASMSAADPAGPQAQRIWGLGLLFIALGSAVYVVVMGVLLYGLWRGDRRVEVAGGPALERRLTRWVAGAIGATTVSLLGLLVANLAVGRATAEFADPGALTIRITGHQWW